MHYGKIKRNDIANGQGVRVTLFCSGCRRCCPGCFQPETWDFDYGQPYTPADEERIIEWLSPDYVDGLTLLGGEPFEPENLPELIRLVKRVNRELPEKNIWAYTGFMYEELTGADYPTHSEYAHELLGLIDVLVDGAFDESLKNLSLPFRGSSNQRIIDVKESLKSGEVIIWEDCDV